MTPPMMRLDILRARLTAAGILAYPADVKTILAAETILRRWAQRECNGEIQRDEVTGKPHGVSVMTGINYGPIPDRERAALERMVKLCKRLGCHFYHQTDPRGAALYLSAAPLHDTNYHNGVCAAV